jgi:hypothetical protein
MKLPVRITDLAWAQFQALAPQQQHQARNLIRAVQLGAPGVGRPWNRDLRNRLHWIASAYDTHVIYRVVYHRRGDELLISAILVYETPPDPNNA